MRFKVDVFVASPMKSIMRRRWWRPRFSLRTLLILVTLLSGVCAFLGYHWNRISTKRAIVAQIENVGGSVTYSYEFGSGREVTETILTLEHWETNRYLDGNPATRTRITPEGTFYEVETPPGSSFIRKWLGDDALAEVDSVRFTNIFFEPPEPIAPSVLLKIPRLKSVTLAFDQVSDEWFVTLAKVPELRAVGLFGADKGTLTAEGLASLCKAKDLKRLIISGEWLCDDTLRGLTELPQLTSLTLMDAPKVTPAAWASIGQLSELKELRVINMPCDVQSLKHLQGLKKLKNLELVLVPVTDDCLKQLEELQSLEIVCVGDKKAEIGDEGVKSLAKLKNLVRLKLYGSHDGDEGAAEISKLKKLKFLRLGNGVTDDSLPFLGQMTQLEELQLSPSKVTDAGLIHLHGLGNLKQLWLGPLPTKGDVDKLKQAIPKCKISCFDEKRRSYYSPWIPGGGN